MKCLAQTQGSKVRVNAVMPGLLLTDWVCIRRTPVEKRAKTAGCTIPTRDNREVQEQGRPE